VKLELNHLLEDLYITRTHGIWSAGKYYGVKVCYVFDLIADILKRPREAFNVTAKGGKLVASNTRKLENSLPNVLPLQVNVRLGIVNLPCLPWVVAENSLLFETLVDALLDGT